MATTSQSSDQRAEQRGLIAAAEAGDERAFRRLVEPHARAIEVHCYRMLGSLQDAEDIAQETLMRAWRTLDRFEQRSSIETWLYRIATNACLDELERRPRRPQPVDPYPDSRLEEAEEPLADPAARYAMREGIELAFLTAIQRLPGRQRAILILRDVLGWTAPEVAELLESTVAGVNSALQRARETIDAELPAERLSAAGPKQRELLDGYMAAWNDGDIDGFVALLRDDALMRMPPEPHVAGALEIGEFFRSGPPSAIFPDTRMTATVANGRPAMVMHVGEEPHGIMVLEIEGDQIAAVDVFRDERLVSKFEDAS